MGKTVAPLLGLAVCWLNVYLVRQALTIAFTGQMHAMHGFWEAVGKWCGAHGWLGVWIPNWLGGLPSEFAYAPMVPFLSAHLGAPVACVIAFCLGPVALFVLVRELTRKPVVAFIAAAIYSLCAPTELLQPDGAFSWQHVLDPRRMYVNFVWDEAPHQLALAFVCFTVVAWSRGWRGAAVVSVALAALASPFGITGCALFGFCWLLACGWSRWRIVASTAVVGYLIVCPFYPPSLFAALRRNGALAPESDWASSSWIVLGLTITMMIALSKKLPFFALLAVLTSSIPILFYRFDLHFIDQPGRYKIEMELALVAAVVVAAAALPLRIKQVLAAAALCFCAYQTVQHRRFSKNSIKAADATKTIEYRVAKWVEANLPNETVYAAGSIAQWLNTFGNVRQYGGGAYPSAINVEQQKLYWSVLGERSADKAAAQLGAAGVGAIIVSGPKSPEFWKPYPRDVDVYTGKLPVLWSEDDTTIYAIPKRAGASGINAHPGWRAYGNRQDEFGQLKVDLKYSELRYEPTFENRACVWISALAMLYQIVATAFASRFKS